MAQRHLSVEKRARQNITRNRRNRVIKSQIRTALKDVEANTDQAQTPKLTTKAQSVLDRAARKNVIHKKKAARVKSQIMRKTSAAKKTETPA